VRRLTSVTGMARIIDPRLRSHQFHMAVAVLAGLIVLALEVDRLGSIGPAMSPAVNASVTVFLAWAIAREIDPDEPRTAHLAAVLSVGARVVAGPGNLAALFMLLLACRITLRSTGLQPTIIDGFLVLPAAAFLAGRTTTGWIAALVLAYALARDHRLPQPASRRSLLAAFLVSAMASAGLVTSEALRAGWPVPDPVPLALAAAGIVAGLFLPGYLPTSETDYTGDLLDFLRFRSARWVLLGGAVLTIAIAGGPAVSGLGAVWAVLTAATLIARRLVPAFGPA